MAIDDEKRLSELRALIERLTDILDEASALRSRLEQSLVASRSSVERMGLGDQRRRSVSARTKKTKQTKRPGRS